MKFDPKIHHRHSIRLQGYDYSLVGAYFVTTVTYGRECLFGEIYDGQMTLNSLGKIVRQAWFDLPRHYPHIELGTFCIMPNHVHMIVVLNAPAIVEAVLSPAISGRGFKPAPIAQKRHPLSEIIRAFKSFSSKRINILRKTQGIPVWQRNYYEHIIRSNEEHNQIHLYIDNNPADWINDQENPEKTA
jgi:REP element-mobilizing transposase RayT